jgi:hypothetical protein
MWHSALMPEQPPSADRLRDAAARVLADFPEGESVSLNVTCWQARDGRWWLKIAEDSGISYEESTQSGPPSEPELLVAIAYYLQDHVFDTEPWGEARPICPGHPHPPDPRIIDEKAVWICPRDGRMLAPIGHLR